VRRATPRAARKTVRSIASSAGRSTEGKRRRRDHHVDLLLPAHLLRRRCGAESRNVRRVLPHRAIDGSAPRRSSRGRNEAEPSEVLGVKNAVASRDRGIRSSGGASTLGGIGRCAMVDPDRTYVGRDGLARTRLRLSFREHARRAHLIGTGSVIGPRFAIATRSIANTPRHHLARVLVEIATRASSGRTRTWREPRSLRRWNVVRFARRRTPHRRRHAGAAPLVTGDADLGPHSNPSVAHHHRNHDV